MLQSFAQVVRAARLLNRQGSRDGSHRQICDAPREPWEENRQKVDEIYGGAQGAWLAVASALSGHLGAAERVLRDRRFDLRGLRSILDVGSGAGQLARPLLRYADTQAQITCCDLSSSMLHRARVRLASAWPNFVVADLAQLPFADGSFDGITCGYVLEHLPDPGPGLSELSRVLMPGGRLLLLTTEDNLFGALTSHTWCCRTYNREELQSLCMSLGLIWAREIHTPRWHQLPAIGGICVELQKPRVALSPHPAARRSVFRFDEKEVCHGTGQS